MSEANPQTIHRVMHEIERRYLEVLRLVDLTPRMRRILLDEHGLSETQVRATDYWHVAGSTEEPSDMEVSAASDLNLPAATRPVRTRPISPGH